MKQLIPYTLTGMMILLGTACSDSNTYPQPVDSDVPVALHARAVGRSEAKAGTGTSARLLFWDESNFHNHLMQESPNEPRFTTVLDEEINHYTYEGGLVYTTSYAYPGNNARIHATGYAPDYVFTPSEHYKTLTVEDPEALNGNVDMLTCQGSTAHSATAEETFLQEGKELKFQHLTAKLTFIGQRHEDMHDMVGVRDIYIYLYNEDNNLVVPKVFTLYTQGEETSDTKEDDYSTYVPVESELKPLDNRKELHYEGVIPKNTSVELGTCYLLSNNFEYGSTGNAFNPITGEWSNGTPSGRHPELKVAIKAILYDAERPDNQNAWVTETWENVAVETWTIANTGDKLLPGYEYKVTLVFNRASVALRAEAVPWEDEELHEYPVHPMSTTPTPGN